MRTRAGGGIAQVPGAKLVLLLLCAGLPLTGCASRPSWDRETHTLVAGEIRYRVGRLPPGWQILRAERAGIGFWNARVGGVIAANATCRDDAEGVALTVLTNQLLIGYTDRRFVERRDVMLDARAAQHTVVDARLDGVPMRLDLYVLKRNGCIYDLSYAAPPSTSALGLPDFHRFVAGFSDEKRPA